MKNWMLILVGIACLSSGCNRYRAELGIRKAFPNAQIKSGYPLEKYHFIVKDNTNSYYIVCYGTSCSYVYENRKNFWEIQEIDSFFVSDKTNVEK